MKQYLDIVKHVLENGVEKYPTRKNPNTGEWEPVDGGVKTLACANVPFSHDMANGFPLLTTKKVAWKSVRVELEGFIKGITSKRWYQDRGCKIWNEWSNQEQIPTEIVLMTDEGEVCDEIRGDKKDSWQKENPDLGPLGYSHGWRNFGGDYKPIPYIWTELDKNIEIEESEDALVGQEFDGKYGVYTVISYDGKDKHHNKRYTVKFHKSGFTKNNLNSRQIKELKVFDPYYPQIAGVACVGDYKWIPLDKRIVEQLMNQWRQMIQRCYNKNNKAYKNYGGNGVWVSNRWLVFEYFLLDVQNIKGWNSKLRDWRGYQLDKNINGGTKYSKDACLWVTVSHNANNTRQNYYFDAYSPNGELYENVVGLARFCRKHKLKVKNVEASIKSGGKTEGWKFVRKEQFKKRSVVGTDQLTQIVNTLLANPNDRRMVCSAWDVKNLSKMALPPCHWGWNVTVIGDKLNLFWVQRSCDLALGVPFNIASYALLLSLLAYTADLVPGNLSAMFVDCHIYENHIEGMKEQINREPRPLPHIYFYNNSGNLKKKFHIFDWTYQDVELVDYNPHPKINFGGVTV